MLLLGICIFFLDHLYSCNWCSVCLDKFDTYLILITSGPEQVLFWLQVLTFISSGGGQGEGTGGGVRKCNMDRAHCSEVMPPMHVHSSKSPYVGKLLWRYEYSIIEFVEIQKQD